MLIAILILMIVLLLVCLAFFYDLSEKFIECNNELIKIYSRLNEISVDLDELKRYVKYKMPRYSEEAKENDDDIKLIVKALHYDFQKKIERLQSETKELYSFFKENGDV